LLGSVPVVGWGVLGALLLSGHEVTRGLGRSLQRAPHLPVLPLATVSTTQHYDARANLRGEA